MRPPFRLADDYDHEAHGARCVACGTPFGYMLSAAPDGSDRRVLVPVWEDALRQGYCEDCAYEIEAGVDR